MKHLILFICSLSMLIFLSCNDEPVAVPIINQDTFEVDSELYLLLERAAGNENQVALDCIEFNYSFVLFTFDEAGNYIEPIPVSNDTQLIILLENLPAGHSVSVSYPITATNTSGEVIEITNNQQLLNIIQQCIEVQEEEQIGNCNNTIETCDWRVAVLDEFPNDYEGYMLTVNDDGILQFHIENEIFLGTWFSFFLTDELHLNINFFGSEELENFWNKDWKVITLTNELIDIEYEGERVQIRQDCSIDCDEVFTECEIEDMPGIALFQLNNYTLCQILPPNHPAEQAVSISYFETIEDAEDNSNALDPIDYQNTTNPQTIFARVVSQSDDILINIQTFTIEAVFCD